MQKISFKKRAPRAVRVVVASEQRDFRASSWPSSAPTEPYSLLAASLGFAGNRWLDSEVRQFASKVMLTKDVRIEP